jgi:hypothetical protein
MCSFTNVEAEEAERDPNVFPDGGMTDAQDREELLARKPLHLRGPDPWPKNAPLYVEAVNPADRLTLLLLGMMRATNRELAAATNPDASYAKAQAAVAEGYRLELLERDVAGAIWRARSATLSRIAADEENSPSTRWTARKQLEELRP